MAAGPRLPLRLLLLLLPPLVWPVSPHTAGPAGRGRRFSELKVCADAECSMLMYRGEALEDFRGPDCRFVNFTKGDSVYVYYKLAGISPEVWAGSVGQTFGYFPRDLIHVAYEYTKEELQVPADETDFVCFSGGRDDFSNYSVEELLAYLELPSPATGDSEETSANAPPEASEDHGLQSPVDSSSEGREGSSPGALGNSQASEDSGEPAPSPPPPDAPTELSQRAPPSSKPLDMMRDERQAPTGDNSRSSNSSQGPGGQGERTDAYKLLRQEMTLDLKTKFGSTADALVSDDETTRLVTSLEDELSEDLEAEYYTAGQEDEEEEEEDGIEDMPLLTFRGGDDGDDGPSPGRTAVEEGTAGQEPNSSEGAREQVPWALGAANSGHRLRDGADGGAAQPGTSAGRWAEHKSTEDAGALSAAGSHGVDPPPPSAPELPAPAGMAGALGIRGVLQASKAKVSEVDTDKHVHGKGGDVGTERGPMLGETEAEEEQLQEHRVFPPGSGQHSGPAASKDGDPGGAVVHISKEESVGEPAQEGGPGRNRPPSLSSTTGSGKNQQQDSVSGAEKDGVPGSPGPLHTLSREPPKEASKEPPAPNSQSALSESHLLAGLGDGAPAQGRNGSGPPEPAAAVEMEQVGEGKGRLSKAEAEEDFLEEEAVHGAPEVDPAGQTVGAEAPGSQPGEAEEEAEADDYTPEEQLEDENAVSARQARASSTETQDRPLGADLQGPGGADTGALGNVLETKGHREETGRKSEMGNPGEDPASRVPGGAMTPEGAGAVAGHGAQRASTGQDTPGSETHQQGPEAAAAPQMVGSEPTEGEHPEEIPGGSGELTDMAGLEAAKTSGPEPSDDDSSLAHWPPQHLPIISSFFKDLQSWQRFQKYVEARELEALLQDLAVKLAAAQRESLPYNAEKVLDKVFRTAEAHILSEAERMLDARGSDSQDPSARDREAFEEAAVLDDVQDLIYFVRYQHPTAEPPTLPAMPPPPGDTWEGPVEDPQPPVAEDLSQEKMEDVQAPEPDLIPEEPSTEDPAGVSTTQASPEPSPEDPAGASTTQVSPHPSPEDPAGASTTQVSPEPSPKDPAGASTTQASPEPSPEDPAGVSTTQVSPEPSPEEDTDTGMLVPGSSPVDTVGTDTQPEADVEEAARATPLDSAALLIYSGVASVTQALVAALPEDVQPGPDFYGLPWQPLLATALLGVVSFVLFWRMILEVKSKKYQVTEQQISEKVKNLKKENSELAQQLSDYEQKLKESKKLAQETKKLNAVLSDKAVKYEDKIKKLEESNEALNGTTRNLQDLLESERVQNAKNQDLILENKKSIQKLKDVILMNASELSEVQIALNEAKLGEEKVKFECQRIQEENIKLKKKKEQLQQEVQVWTKSHSELSEQLKSFAQLQKDMEVTVSLQQEDIGALTNCITQLNCLDCESELESQNRGGIDSDELANGEVAGDQQEKLKSRIRQMMDVSRTQTAVAVVEEDLKLLQSKLRAAMSTRCTLEDQIKKLEDDRSSLLSVKSDLEDECKALKQKVEILNELYQEKEMMLQKKLSQEEYERQEREQRLSAADEKADLAAEEVKTYKRRIEEMEEELVKTERSFKSQIAAHEKKAHDNWLKARAAERAMAEEKRESTNLRHKLLEMTQKMAMMREEPVIVKPLPGRPSAHNPPCRGPLSQNGSFGPSPVSGGECSPPLPADSPARPLSATTLNRREASRSEFDAAASGAAPMMNNASGNSSPSRALDEGKVPVAVKGPPSFPGMPLLGGPMGGPPPPPVRYGVPPQLIRPFGPRPMPPMPQPFGPGLRPLVGLREYAPGVPPGKRDGPYDPREFVPGHAPFRPLGPSGPREYFIPGTRLPPPPPHGPQDYPPQPHGPQDYQSPPHGPQDYPRPPHGPQDYPRPPHGPQDYPRPPHGPQDYPPPVAARDLAPSGFQDEAPHASQAGGLSASQAPRQSP